MLQRLGLKERGIVHPWVNKALEKAQQKVEAHNYEIRKNLLKYDNVMNDQRKVIYDQRLEMMQRRGQRDRRRHAPCRRRGPGGPAPAGQQLPEQWDIAVLTARCGTSSRLAEPLADWADEDGMTAARCAPG